MMKKKDNLILWGIYLGMFIGMLLGMTSIVILITFDFNHIIESNGYVKQLSSNYKYIEAYVNTTEKGLCIIRFDYGCPYTTVVCQSDLFKYEGLK